MAWFPVVRWLSRRILRWIYRDIVVVGGELLPGDGAVLAIANHPNDLSDVLIGYLTLQRDARFVATISAASSPPARAVYRGLRVIPVTRIRDVRRLLQQGADIAEVNRLAYRRVVEAVSAGDVVAIFPEGGVTDLPELGKFRPGVAQMAQMCFSSGRTTALQVAPMGIQYEAPKRPGSDCVVVLAPSILLDYSLVNEGLRSTTRVSGQLRGALEQVTRNAPTWEERAKIELVTAAVAASLANRADGGLPIAGVVGPMVSKSLSSDPKLVASLHGAAAQLATICRRVGAHPESAAELAALRFHAESPPRTVRNRGLPYLALTTPLALLGWLTHGPVFAFIWRYAQRTAEAPPHLVARAIMPGLYIVVAWYLVITSLAAAGLWLLDLTPWFSLLLLPVLPYLGDIAVEWRQIVSLRQLHQRARRLSLADRALVDELFERIRHVWLTRFPGHDGLAQRMVVRVIA